VIVTWADTDRFSKETVILPMTENSSLPRPCCWNDLRNMLKITSSCCCLFCIELNNPCTTAKYQCLVFCLKLIFSANLSFSGYFEHWSRMVLFDSVISVHASSSLITMKGSRSNDRGKPISIRIYCSLQCTLASESMQAVLPVPLLFVSQCCQFSK